MTTSPPTQFRTVQLRFHRPSKTVQHVRQRRPVVSTCSPFRTTLQRGRAAPVLLETIGIFGKSFRIPTIRPLPPSPWPCAAVSVAAPISANRYDIARSRLGLFTIGPMVHHRRRGGALALRNGGVVTPWPWCDRKRRRLVPFIGDLHGAVAVPPPRRGPIGGGGGCEVFCPRLPAPHGTLGRSIAPQGPSETGGEVMDTPHHANDEPHPQGRPRQCQVGFQQYVQFGHSLTLHCPAACVLVAPIVPEDFP